MNIYKFRISNFIPVFSIFLIVLSFFIRSVIWHLEYLDIIPSTRLTTIIFLIISVSIFFSIIYKPKLKLGVIDLMSLSMFFLVINTIWSYYENYGILYSNDFINYLEFTLIVIFQSIVFILLVTIFPIH